MEKDEPEGTFAIEKWYYDGTKNRVTYIISTHTPLHEDFDAELMKLVSKHDTYEPPKD